MGLCSIHGKPDAGKPARPVWGEEWRNLPLKGGKALYSYSTTSEEEKGLLKNQLLLTQNAFAGKVLEYEGKLMELQSSIIKAEAMGHSWLQRSWRPITMLTFLVLIILDSFGLLTFRLSAEAWALLKLGLGGYVVGRSAEKVVPSIAEAIKKRE